MASGRRNPDPLRAAAKITGTVVRCVVAHGISNDEALVEVGAALGVVPEGSWSAVLAQAAAKHVDEIEPWRIAALALLVRAGADVDRARAVRASRGAGLTMH